MDHLLNDTIEFLDKIGWRYRREENTNLLALSLRGEKETYPMLIYAKAPFWICIAQLPWEIPDRNRLEVAEYLHRANYGLLLGSFEMDYDNGDVRFRSAMVRENRPMEESILDRYIKTPAAMLDQYAAGIQAIVRDGEIARHALEYSAVHRKGV